jgi:hypothetical protein
MLLISFFSANSNATPNKDLIKKAPALLFLLAMQSPGIICKSIENVGNVANVTLVELLQHLIKIEQSLSSIEQNVNSKCDYYRIDQLRSIAIVSVAVISLSLLLLLCYAYDKCKGSGTRRNAFFTSRYGS